MYKRRENMLNCCPLTSSTGSRVTAANVLLTVACWLSRHGDWWH